jgi:ataxia telangiectasia mutated family protein
MFEAYASQIAFSIQQSQQDFFQFQPRLLGYPNRRSYAEATFTKFSPSNLLAADTTEDTTIGQELFERHCRVIEIDRAEGLRRCFPVVAGCRIALWFNGHSDAAVDLELARSNEQKWSDPLLKILCRDFQPLGSPEDISALMDENIDAIVLTIIRTVGVMDTDREGANVMALQSLESSDRMVRAYRALYKFRNLCDFDVHVPNFPVFQTSVALQALAWLTSFLPSASSIATTYHVMQRLFYETTQSQLINEQLRLFNCLCIHIARNYPHFKNATVLQTLLNGATSLLCQVELLPFGQGLLDWAFIHLKEIQCMSHCIVDALIQTCLNAREHIEAPQKRRRELGQQMMEWLNQQMIMLSEVDLTKRAVRDALAAWPSEVVPALSDFVSDMTPSEISSILANTRISTHKFKIVKQLEKQASDSSYPAENFLKQDFWTLKECIPSDHLDSHDIDSFTSLLLHHSGHVDTPSARQQYMQSVATRHQRIYHPRDDRSRKMSRSSPKRPILMTLMDMLSNSKRSVVWVAYCALRGIAKTMPLDSPDLGSWPSEYRGDVAFLNVCPFYSKPRQCETFEALHSQELLTVGRDYEKWIRIITILFCDILTAGDPFFSYLTPVLEESLTFSEQVFPVLVHALLQDDSAQNRGSKDELSEYMTQLLTQDGTAVASIRCIVQTVLHLRYFQPDKAPNRLDYNKWLNIDFYLLSRSAVACGAYTTALLFLELATEYNTETQLDEVTTEQILSSIYNCIDEPDGFYGIKSKDLTNFLLRRFQHEKQWDRAFQFNGANYEAGGFTPQRAEGILASLHSFGFDNLALSTLQSISPSYTSDMSYTLAWRTETWDLPDGLNSHVQDTALYDALRAIHRERDPATVDNIVRLSLTSEMVRLKERGAEDLRGIRLSVRNLISLAQVRRWRHQQVQSYLTTRSLQTNDEVWSDFCRTYPDIE